MAKGEDGARPPPGAWPRGFDLYGWAYSEGLHRHHGGDTLWRVCSLAPSPPLSALNVSWQITGTLTDLTLHAIMGECGFRWHEEFLETLGEAQKKATRFGVADLFPSSRLLPAVGSRSGDGRQELTRELAGAAVEVGWS
ncbi:Os04g0587000 [Oryza sativa Japonica Group]|uniref:OSJNBb0016D16.2 protein n=2 Tax=Oryza sativa subsp. japonica TaxID=39947 RepID=A0A5S6RD76_ORYSJ|nr:hypothetical protein OsJ_15939 [Oryza sativa Japonica Group]BAS90712.1 Os04g0587000 [Oryza sativa Japonica Group]CAE04311.3 OSJNBb0016D16.2 [Oryza sativa Japonica Group]